MSFRFLMYLLLGSRYCRSDFVPLGSSSLFVFFLSFMGFVAHLHRGFSRFVSQVFCVF